MATAALKRYTPEEYLARERNADFRSEYIDGQIVAMSPGSRRPHNLIVAELVYHLQGHLLGGPCDKEPHVERYVRSGDIWPRNVATGLDESLVLTSVGLEIPLRRLYQKALLPTRRVPRAVQDHE